MFEWSISENFVKGSYGWIGKIIRVGCKIDGFIWRTDKSAFALIKIHISEGVFRVQIPDSYCKICIDEWIRECVGKCIGQVFWI